MSSNSVSPAARALRVLLVEDYEEDAVLLVRQLTRAGFTVTSCRVETAEQLNEALTEPWDLVLADYTLPSFGARDALGIIQAHGVDLPFIIVSGTIDEVSAVSAMRAGAHDYILKGHLERLIPAIERELAESALRREQRETESELRLVQQRFTATFNQAAVGMVHTDPAGHILLVNQRMAEILGRTTDALLKRTLDELIHPAEEPIVAGTLNLHNDLLAGRRTNYRIERRLRDATGQYVPMQMTVSLLQTGEGNGPTLLFVVEDIRARKAAERANQDLMTRLINSERLAAAGRMANTLAHEINNPLEALTNIFFILQGRDDMPLQAQELIGVAAREIDRVGHITRSTLSFYRKVPGRTLNLYALLEEVVQLFASRATQQKITIRTEYDKSIEAASYDPSLRQVFANLVGNALEAMPQEGGTILLRARVTGQRAIVTVSDSGHGVDPAHLRSIFEPFFTTKGERGTGLGLWVTRGIVEEQGGTMHLRTSVSPERHGTTLRITLPIHRDELAAQVS
jgi:PAS domain S-box-containing protein